MGSQKNRLNEMVLFSNQNICLKLLVRKYVQFYDEKIAYLNLCYKPNLLTDSADRFSHVQAYIGQYKTGPLINP